MRIVVDGTSYSSKKKALAEYEEAMLWTDGSEQQRMTFAYMAIKGGCTNIDTHKEIAL